MKTKKLFLALGTVFLFVGVQKSNAQQTPTGWPYYFKSAWQYNWSGSAWVLQDKIIPSYDNNGRGTGAKAYASIGGTWILGAKIHIIYNYNGQAVEQIDSQFNGSGFLPSELDSMWYNTDGTITTEIVYKPNGGGWIPWNRHSYKYANGNKLISEDFQEEWLASTSSWGNDDDYFYSYNSSNAIILITDKNWQANTWVVDHRDTVNFNSVGAVNEVVHQDTGANNKTWVNSSKTVFDTATNAAIAFNNEHSIKVELYPNPSKGNVVLKINKENISADTRLVLMNISGVTVSRIQIANEETTIKTAGLAPGIYLYQLLNGKGEITNGKLVIQ